VASKDNLWWPPVVMGGGRGVSRVFGQSLERKRGENCVFMLKNVFIICRSCLASLSH